MTSRRLRDREIAAHGVVSASRSALLRSAREFQRCAACNRAGAEAFLRARFEEWFAALLEVRAVQEAIIEEVILEGRRGGKKRRGGEDIGYLPR